MNPGYGAFPWNSLKMLLTSANFLATLGPPVYVVPNLFGLVRVLVLIGLARAIPVNPAPYSVLPVSALHEALLEYGTTKAAFINCLRCLHVRLIRVVIKVRW